MSGVITSARPNTDSQQVEFLQRQLHLQRQSSQDLLGAYRRVLEQWEEFAREYLSGKKGTKIINMRKGELLKATRKVLS